MISKYYFLLFCLIPFVSCSQSKKQSEEVKNEAPILKQSFSTLQFESDGKPCIASINNRYIGFKEKTNYSLSLFIIVNTLEKDKNGHPTEKEAAFFNDFQTQILQKLSTALGDYCYIGTTTMTDYRDILLYIKPEHQKIAIEILEKVKAEESRIQSISFEEDTQWEAVSGFYEAVEVKF
ncbi:DUF695 domain-containing protein [Daejeonella sp.]|jgi:hypothetical protein|uniref:DUF695 domain-containing protein n=1 Tax=Daejeonella sp. TaxID=2805397 RepID=UPI0037C083F7